MRELLLARLRADFAVFETWQYQEDDPLPVPMTVLGGSADDWVTQAELAAWAQHAGGPFSCRQLPGGHLFHLRPSAEPLNLVRESLLAAPAP